MVLEVEKNVRPQIVILADRPDHLLPTGTPKPERQGERFTSKGKSQEASFSLGKRLLTAVVNKGELMTIDVLPQKNQSVQNIPLMEVFMEDQWNKLQVEKRLPLLDCTNQNLSMLREAGKKRISGTKGQWKRQARLQWQKACVKELSIVNSQRRDDRKRERTDTETDVAMLKLHTSGKKGKSELLISDMSNLKVDKTSLNWSRFIR